MTNDMVMPARAKEMPDRVKGFRWWAEAKDRFFERLAPHIDGFGKAMAFPDKGMLGNVKVFDTTARDGMQTPEVPAFVTEQRGRSVVQNKVEICMRLAQWGIPIIEVGNAVSNDGEVEAIKTVKRMVEEQDLGTEIVSLGRMVRRDVDAAKLAEADTMHVYSSGSVPHAWVKLGKMPEELIPDIVDCVRYAREQGFANIIVSLEDAARTDPDHLVEVGKRIFDAAGGKGIQYNIPDTVGVCSPAYMYALISHIRSEIPELPLQVHCHNDMGMAAQNSIAAMLAGVSVVQTTMHGVGERTGNAALEEVAMYMYANHGIEIVDMAQLADVSAFISERFGVGPAMNKPIVGKRAFRHTAGVHVDGLVKSEKSGFSDRDSGRDGGSVYAAFNPRTIGREEDVWISALSGKKSITHKLGEFGISVPDDNVDAILSKVKDMAATKAVSDADFLLMAYDAAFGKPCRRADVISIDVSTGTSGRSARVLVKVGDDEREGEDTEGNGTVDVAVRAIRSAIGNGTGIEISSYECHGIGSGSDAAARVTMTIRKKGLEVESSTVGTDTTMVSIEAFTKGYDAVCALEELRSAYPAAK